MYTLCIHCVNLKSFLTSYKLNLLNYFPINHTCDFPKILLVYILNIINYTLLKTCHIIELI